MELQPRVHFPEQRLTPRLKSNTPTVVTQWRSW
jgi:hypothetical protein